MSELAHKTEQIGSVTLHYVEAGSGPLVVLLHGFPEFWYSWRKQIPALAAAGYRVIAPDLRGAIKRIDVPAMLVWGERDPVFIRATTEAFGEWVPDLRVERIPQAGHFVQNDAPEKVNELLLAFLRATRPTAP